MIKYDLKQDYLMVRISSHNEDDNIMMTEYL